MKPLLSAVLIVRDEEANLARCLDSLARQADEIVIVDTGSRDGTVGVARRFTDRVFEYPWRQDFSAARNYGLDRANGDWILSLDADESLEAGTENWTALLRRDPGRFEAYLLPLHYYHETTAGYQVHHVLRLFKNSPEYRFQGSIHEQVRIRDPLKVGVSDRPVIKHHFIPERERRRKRGRNLSLLQQKLRSDPQNPFLQYYLGLEWLGLGRAARALPLLDYARQTLGDDQLLFRLPAVHYCLNALRTLGRLDEALAVCDAELGRYPDYADLWFDGGILLEMSKTYQAAIARFTKALECGAPPPLHFHTEGSAGFMAFYHIGHCHDQMGRRGEAGQWYRRALEDRPEVVFPIVPLFLGVLAEAGAPACHAAFEASGDLADGQRGPVLAELFFEAGYADLAAQCLTRPAVRAKIATEQCLRWLVYSGRPRAALAELDGIIQSGAMLSVSSRVDQISALLLTGNGTEARHWALRLWQDPSARPQAIALLNLLHWIEKGRIGCHPEPPAVAPVLATLLALIDNCLRTRFAPVTVQPTPYEELLAHIWGLLVRLTPVGAEALAAYFREKAVSWMKIYQARLGCAIMTDSP